MPTSFIVVDDFLENPDAFRDQALKLEYPEQQGPYPGRNSVQRLDLPGLSQYVSQLVGEPLKPVEPLQSHGKCRIALGSDPRRGNVHVDESQWSGILYLSKNADGKSGTDFFRHKATGLERSPITDAEAHSMGLAGRDAVIADTIVKDGNKRSAWEKTMEIPMRYNRLLLLRPWFFHSSGPGFGRTVKDGRLIYVMFFTLAR